VCTRHFARRQMPSCTALVRIVYRTVSNLMHVRVHAHVHEHVHVHVLVHVHVHVHVHVRRACKFVHVHVRACACACIIPDYSITSIVLASRSLLAFE